MIRITIICFYLLAAWLPSGSAFAQTKLELVWLTQEKKVEAALSNLDAVPEDEGVQGARLAVTDNNTTGLFTGQNFSLKEVVVHLNDDPLLQFETLAKEGYRHFITDLPADKLSQLGNHPLATEVLIYNVSASDDSLRGVGCRSNFLHILPSRAMRADALGQYLLKKRWKKLFLVVGPDESDARYAEAVRRSAKKFGLKIVSEKKWTHTYDARRTAQSDVPLFTRGEDYDVLVVADEKGLFGEYLEYRSWLPRPVAGTQGLVPVAWHRTHEQWGAVQLQNRFNEQAGRWMSEIDYAAWLAVRSIGEAATRTNSLDFSVLKRFMLGDEFAVAGFKGKKLSFRGWNNQLRQPVLLAAARSMVAVAPLPGFLHPVTMLDTLGYDKTESRCNSGNQE